MASIIPPISVVIKATVNGLYFSLTLLYCTRKKSCGTKHPAVFYCTQYPPRFCKNHIKSLPAILTPQALLRYTLRHTNFGLTDSIQALESYRLQLQSLVALSVLLLLFHNPSLQKFSFPTSINTLS